MAKDENVSLKGLDSFSKQFLNNSQTLREDDAEYIKVTEGQTLNAEAVKRYEDVRTRDFIKRAASFTDDLVGFVIQQRKFRSLSDIEVIFGLALANINLRNAYGNPPNQGTDITQAQRDALLSQFDDVCVCAQEYYDANT